MECQASDSKKLLKVFDASKRKRGRRKREVGESKSAVRSVGSDLSSPSQAYKSQIRVSSAKASLQEVRPSKTEATPNRNERDVYGDSSPSLSRSPSGVNKSSPSPRRHRRPTRDSMSLALKAGFVSTPRSDSPPPDGDGTFDSVPQDQGSFIYAFLEEAIKKDKRRQRHARRHEERERTERPSRARESTPCDKDHREHRDHRDHRDHREHREHRHHHRHDDEPREPEKPPKVETPASPAIDQTVLIETFAKLCATLNAKTESLAVNNVQRSLSHKSLQCENISKQTCCNDLDHRPVKSRSHENSHNNIPESRLRSHEDNQNDVVHIRSRDDVVASRSHLTEVRGRSTYCVPYDKENPSRERYSSKLDVARSKMHNVIDDRCRDYVPRPAPTRSCLDQSYRRNPNDPHGSREHIPTRDPPRDCDHRRKPNREYDHDRELNRDYDRVRNPDREKYYDDERRRYFEQKTSRSYETHPCVGEEPARRTSRSETNKEKRYDDRRYDDRDRQRLYEEMEKRDKYYEDKPLVSRDRNCNTPRDSRERRSKKYVDRLERASITSREEEYKEKDRYSERERDSGLSVADGESSASVRSNYLRLVKQEITEQREAMDKMMSLWKELMRCFKNIQTTGSEKAVTESAANNARESAAAQLRLWRECMRRYETVARDVGDTDARLMEEINKQRSEMAEMATMWQECLQRYREMSSDFNNLKQKLAAPPSPVRVLPQPVCAEGEGQPSAASFHPPAYPPVPTPVYGGGSPVRARASAPAPPPWWWGEAPGMVRPPPGRRSSPDSHGSRDRDRERERRRHKDREREDSRYKEKSKPSATRSEQRRRKR